MKNDQNFVFTEIAFPDEYTATISQLDSEKAVTTKYSCWQEYEGGYIPTVDMKIVDNLPSGCYKIEYDNRINDYKIHNINIHNDEIYRFDNSNFSSIINEVHEFWNRESIYKTHNIIHKRGLLLEGPAGNGKSGLITLLIEDLLKEDGIVFIVNSLKDLQMLIEAMSTIVTKIEKERKIITVIEDIDKLIESNNGDDAFILDFLDGKSSIEHQLVIMTSNDTSNLSPALLRPSRIDMRFVIPFPNSSIREEFLRRKGIPEDKLNEYVKKTKGMTFAQLKEVFIGTVILGKDIDTTIELVNSPLVGKNYLNKTTRIGL